QQLEPDHLVNEGRAPAADEQQQHGRQVRRGSVDGGEISLVHKPGNPTTERKNTRAAAGGRQADTGPEPSGRSRPRARCAVRRLVSANDTTPARRPLTTR